MEELHDRIREDLVGLENRKLRDGWRIYLARIESELAGCAVLKPIDAIACELKRLFVVRHLQGLGIGSALCEYIFTTAGQLGFNLRYC
jgi:GNAT superfamily N-acetyltransferase